MSLRSRARYVQQATGRKYTWCREAIIKLGPTTAELAYQKGIKLKEADLELIKIELDEELRSSLCPSCRQPDPTTCSCPTNQAIPEQEEA